MPTVAEPLAHDETIPAPGWLRALLLLALSLIGLSLGAALVAGNRSGADAVAFWVALPVSAAAIGFTYANFLALRIQVSGTELRFAYGLFRKRIPFHDIESVDHRDYRWARYGGWGLRYGMLGRCCCCLPAVTEELATEVQARSNCGRPNQKGRDDGSEDEVHELPPRPYCLGRRTLFRWVRRLYPVPAMVGLG